MIFMNAFNDLVLLVLSGNVWGTHERGEQMKLFSFWIESLP